MADKPTQKTQNFEKSMERLEKIVEDMEGGELSLEKMIADFEEGQKLVKFCQGKLSEVERKIELLVNEQGDTKPFEESDTADPESGEATDLF